MSNYKQSYDNAYLDFAHVSSGYIDLIDISVSCLVARGSWSCLSWIFIYPCWKFVIQNQWLVEILNSSDNCRRGHFCGKHQFKKVYIAKKKTHFEMIKYVLTKDDITWKPFYMMKNNENFQLTRSFEHKIKGRIVVFIDLLILRILLGSNPAHSNGLSFHVQISDNAWWRLVKSSGIKSNFVIILGSTFLKFLRRYRITHKISDYTCRTHISCKFFMQRMH